MRRFSAYLSVVVASALLAAAGPAAGGNFSIPPSEAERRLGREPFEILEAKRTASGVAGAQKWTLRFADGKVIKAKWKSAPSFTADGWNNSPRREIAAYDIQKWFLDEADYVVPPSEVRCIPLATYREIDSGARSTLVGVDCVFGVLSLWLQDVEEPAEIWHPELFEAGGYYRDSIAAVDVLTLLVGHKDGRPANFLWSTDDRRHVFSIDNGISFGAFPFNFLVTNWHGLRVPALSRKVVDRLRKVGPDEIEKLAILRHLEADSAGILKLTPAPGNLGPDKGTRTRRDALQFGLRESELKEVEARVRHLIQLADGGGIALF